MEEEMDDHETYQQWAERCWRADGEEIPPQGTKEWEAKYEAFIDIAFADMKKRSKKYNAEKKRSRRRRAPQ